MPLIGGVDTESGALVLIGTAKAFQKFADTLRSDARCELALPAIVERPGIRGVTNLRLEPATGEARILVSEDSAILSGSRDARVRLAEEVRSFVEHNDLDEPGMHTHVDSATTLLVRDSCDLVLAGAVMDSEIIFVRLLEEDVDATGLVFVLPPRRDGSPPAV